MINEMKKNLESIAELLRNNNESDLARSLDALSSRADEDPETFMHDVKRLFGGMGSLSDIVFSKNGKPLIDENNKLDTLRKNLYKACP